uniref:Large ribosomal subunit protein uL22c n=1 Tax=Carnegiea gigantea TaxID=171969 RepID=A0A0K0Q5U3_9CARY|nr:ribosomal protein L22 [Carnegiea gigantea]AKR06814.1 ribosomal protein L22 [Carnegiea gigantea]
MKKIRGTYAFGRYIPMSAHKAQRVINQIRGRSYEEALMILTFMPYRACYPIFNLIEAAGANAEHNRGFDTTELMISKVEVNKGTKRKKIKPRAQGRNSIIKRPTCHITIVLQKPFFLVQLGNDIFPLSKKDTQQIWYAAKFSNSRMLDDIIFRLIMKGELKIY